MICTNSGIEGTQNNNLFLAGNVPDDGCEVLVEHVIPKEGLLQGNSDNW